MIDENKLQHQILRQTTQFMKATFLKVTITILLGCHQLNIWLSLGASHPFTKAHNLLATLDLSIIGFFDVRPGI